MATVLTDLSTELAELAESVGSRIARVEARRRQSATVNPGSSSSSLRTEARASSSRPNLSAATGSLFSGRRLLRSPFRPGILSRACAV